MQCTAAGRPQAVAVIQATQPLPRSGCLKDSSNPHRRLGRELGFKGGEQLGSVARHGE